MDWDLLKLTPDDSYEELDTTKNNFIMNNNSNHLLNSSHSFTPNQNPSRSCSRSRSNSIVYRKTNNLDISRISDKILVMSRCWQNEYNHSTSHSTSVQPQKHNTIDEVATFLNTKYKDRYMIWNIGTTDSLYSPSYFNFRVINSALPKSQIFTVKHLFHLCHSILGWLQLNSFSSSAQDSDSEGVAIIQCNDGWKRCSLLVSCLLKFAGSVASTFDGFELFSLRRKHKFEEDFMSSISTTRYLKYFNDVLMHAGKLMNPDPLNLHQIIISSIPNFDGSGGCLAGVEIFQNNNLLFSSSDSDSDSNEIDNNIFYFKDNFHIIFRFNENELDRDILIHIFHTHPQTRQRSTIFSFPFNTGFVHPGVIRLKPTDLEIPSWNCPPPTSIFNMKSSDQNRFSKDFTVDLIMLPVNAKATTSASVVDYCSSTKNNFAKNLIRLSQMHPVRPDTQLSNPLELQGFRKFYVKLALQLHGNDIHQAHEYLTTLHEKKKLVFEAFDKSFMDLTHRGQKNKKDNGDVKDDNSTTATNEIASNTTENHKHNRVTVNTSETVNNNNIENSRIIEDININQDICIGNTLDSMHVEEELSKVEKEEPEDTYAIHVPPLPPPPPPLPNLFNKSIPPPPPPPLPSNNLKTNSMEVEEIGRPRVKNALHWQELDIDPMTVGRTPKLTVWHEFAFGSFETEVEIDVKKFEETFCISRRPSASGNKTQTTLQQERGEQSQMSQSELLLLPKVIDIRRANNVAIGLSRFTRRFSTSEVLIEAILKNDEKLTLDDFLTIQTVLPTAEEEQKFRIKKQKQKQEKEQVNCNDHDQLNESERFLNLIVNSYSKVIPMLVKFRIFSSTALTDLSGIIQKFEAITEGLKGLKGSVEFKIILKSILDLGNLANYEYSSSNTSAHHTTGNTNTNTNAVGFTLNSLCKLHEMKSVDGKSNLLIFLTNSLLSKHPEIISLIDSEYLRNLEILKGWHGRGLHAELMKISHGANEIEQELVQIDEFPGVKAEIEEFMKRFKEFYREKVDIIIAEFDEIWLSTREYFYGNDSSLVHQKNQKNATVDHDHDDDVSSFFANIWQFLKNLESAVKAVTTLTVTVTRSRIKEEGHHLKTTDKNADDITKNNNKFTNKSKLRLSRSISNVSSVSLSSHLSLSNSDSFNNLTI